MARHMHWHHGHHHHWHRPMSMHRNPFGMFFGIAFGFMMLSFLFKSGLIFFRGAVRRSDAYQRRSFNGAHDLP